MKKISSGSTFVTKKVFPILWFGILAAVVGFGALEGAAFSDPMFLVGPAVMAVFGFFLMKKMAWDLADEVFDCGDYLLVKNRGMDERVDLSNIMNVSVSTAANPPRITLRLVKPGRLGGEIAFSPQMGLRLNPFAKSQVAEDLMVRVDKARSRRAV